MSHSEMLLLTDGKQVKLTGIATVLPDHADKAMRQGVSAKTGDFLFAGEYRAFPKGLIGSSIHVTGVIREKRLPMFEHPNDGTPAPQGIPVPKGTDIEKKSIYYVIEDPVWVVDD